MTSGLEIQSPACRSMMTLLAPESNAACSAAVESSAFQPNDETFTQSAANAGNIPKTAAAKKHPLLFLVVFISIFLFSLYSSLTTHNSPYYNPKSAEIIIRTVRGQFRFRIVFTDHPLQQTVDNARLVELDA